MTPSVAADTSATGEPPSERYGRRTTNDRRTVMIVAIVVGAIAVAVFGWVAWGQLQPSADGEVGVFEPVGDSQVDLILEVTRPPGREATCTIEALGEGFGQVGLLEVSVPASQERVSRVQVTMATSERASVAMVRTCELR